MTTTIQAIYDGSVFVPEQPVDIPSRARCKLVVEIEYPAASADKHEAVDDQWLLDQIEKLPPIDLPADFASQHDHYLYGLPKR